MSVDQDVAREKAALYAIKNGIKIGEGSFGCALLVKHRDTEKQYILKRIRMAKQSAWQRQSTLQERDMISSLRHPFIVPHIDNWITDKHTVNMVIGYCENGDLQALLAKQQKQGKCQYLAEDQLRYWLCQALLALAYLQEHKVVHRDIKTSNLLLTADNDLQLGDFGLATYRDAGDSHKREDCNRVGTPHYMSPELLKYEDYDFQTDVWSLGCVFYELSYQRPAFEAFGIEGLVRKIKEDKVRPRPPHHAGQYYTQAWHEILLKMLTKDPLERSTVYDLMALQELRPQVEAARRRALELQPDLLLPPFLPGLVEAQHQEQQQQRLPAEEPWTPDGTKGRASTSSRMGSSSDGCGGGGAAPAAALEEGVWSSETEAAGKSSNDESGSTSHSNSSSSRSSPEKAARDAGAEEAGSGDAAAAAAAAAANAELLSAASPAASVPAHGLAPLARPNSSGSSKPQQQQQQQQQQRLRVLRSSNVRQPGIHATASERVRAAVAQAARPNASGLASAAAAAGSAAAPAAGAAAATAAATPASSSSARRARRPVSSPGGILSTQPARATTSRAGAGLDTAAASEEAAAAAAAAAEAHRRIKRVWVEPEDGCSPRARPASATAAGAAAAGSKPGSAQRRRTTGGLAGTPAASQQQQRQPTPRRPASAAGAMHAPAAAAAAAAAAAKGVEFTKGRFVPEQQQQTTRAGLLRSRHGSRAPSAAAAAAGGGGGGTRGSSGGLLTEQQQHPAAAAGARARSAGGALQGSARRPGPSAGAAGGTAAVVVPAPCMVAAAAATAAAADFPAAGGGQEKSSGSDGSRRSVEAGVLALTPPKASPAGSAPSGAAPAAAAAAAPPSSSCGVEAFALPGAQDDEASPADPAVRKLSFGSQPCSSSGLSPALAATGDRGSSSGRSSGGGGNKERFSSKRPQQPPEQQEQQQEMFCFRSGSGRGSFGGFAATPSKLPGLATSATEAAPAAAAAGPADAARDGDSSLTAQPAAAAAATEVASCQRRADPIAPSAVGARGAAASTTAGSTSSSSAAQAATLAASEATAAAAAAGAAAGASAGSEHLQQEAKLLRNVCAVVAGLLERGNIEAAKAVLTNSLPPGVVPAATPATAAAGGGGAAAAARPFPFELGHVVAFGRQRKMEGCIRYIGPVHWDPRGQDYVGIELAGPQGTKGGTVDGVFYFDAPHRHALFEQTRRLTPDA